MTNRNNDSDQENAGTSKEEQAEYWDQDLRPGVVHPEKADGVKTAYDIKGLHNRLTEFTNDELKQIPVLPTGTRLEQNATYIDLRRGDAEEFSGDNNMSAAADMWLVPKSEVDYQLWNRLIGVTNPERTGEASE